MTDNQQRAAEMRERAGHNTVLHDEQITAALDAAEARGRADMAAKVEELCRLHTYRYRETYIAVDELRAWIAAAAPEGKP